LNFPEVYIVTEDTTLKESIGKLNDVGLNFSNLKIVDPKEALAILIKRCK
jgi:hypothetical protein